MGRDLTAEPFEIEGSGHEAVAHTSNSIVLFQAAPNSKTTIFRRRAIKKDMSTGEATQFESVVAELDGVRAYVTEKDGKTIVILSKEDIYP